MLSFVRITSGMCKYYLSPFFVVTPPPKEKKMSIILCQKHMNTTHTFYSNKLSIRDFGKQQQWIKFLQFLIGTRLLAVVAQLFNFFILMCLI